jgi:hypothetical protein
MVGRLLGRCGLHQYLALRFMKVQCFQDRLCDGAFLAQVLSLPRGLQCLWPGLPVHGSSRLLAAHCRLGSPDTLHVHYCRPRRCRLQATQVQGQRTGFHYSRLTLVAYLAWIDEIVFWSGSIDYRFCELSRYNL